MDDAIYVIEHPDHVITVHYLSPDSEKEILGKMLREGILSVEKLGITRPPSDWVDENVLLMHCGRPLIPLWHWLNDGEYFMTVDHAEKLLAAGGSEYKWMAEHGEYGARVSLRFGPSLTELVCLPYKHWNSRIPESIALPLYIQETMIRPICTLSVDPGDPTYANCDWREYLGTVQANIVGKETVDVSLDDVNRLVSGCSRPMLLVSHALPPTYIPKQWLERGVAACRAHSGGKCRNPTIM